MKLNELDRKLQENPEFAQAMDDLMLHFELANAVLRARLQKGWSQTELAQRVGTKQANISRIESGLANPTWNLIQKILLVLDLEINFLPAPPAASYRQPPMSQSVSVAPGSKTYKSGQIQHSHRIQDGE